MFHTQSYCFGCQFQRAANIIEMNLHHKEHKPPILKLILLTIIKSQSDEYDSQSLNLPL